MAIMVQNDDNFECDEHYYLKVRGHQEHDGGLSFVITRILMSG